MAKIFSPRAFSESTMPEADADEGSPSPVKHLLNIYGPSFLISTVDSDGPGIEYTAVIDPAVSGGHYVWSAEGGGLEIKPHGKHQVACTVRTEEGSSGNKTLKCEYWLGKVGPVSAQITITIRVPHAIAWNLSNTQAVQSSDYMDKRVNYQLLDQYGAPLSTVCSFADGSGATTNVVVAYLLASEIFTATNPVNADTTINFSLATNCYWGDTFRANKNQNDFTTVQTIYVHQKSIAASDSNPNANPVSTKTVHWGEGADPNGPNVFWFNELTSDPDNPQHE